MIIYKKNFYLCSMRCFTSSSKILFCLSCLCVFAIFSCKKEEQKEVFVEKENFDYIEPAVEQFREYSDSKVNYKTALHFSRASLALVSMGLEWAERIEQADDEEKLKLAAAYEKAQDELIRKFGIKGKEEFKWLQTKALLEPENKDVFAKAGVWIGK